jgi:hypothetical protein
VAKADVSEFKARAEALFDEIDSSTLTDAEYVDVMGEIEFFAQARRVSKEEEMKGSGEL